MFKLTVVCCSGFRCDTNSHSIAYYRRRRIVLTLTQKGLCMSVYVVYFQTKSQQCRTTVAVLAVACSLFSLSRDSSCQSHHVSQCHPTDLGSVSSW